MVKEMAIGKSSKILFNKSLMMEEQNNPIIRRFQVGRKRVAATPTWTVNGGFVVMIFLGSA